MSYYGNDDKDDGDAGFYFWLVVFISATIYMGYYWS